MAITLPMRFASLLPLVSVSLLVLSACVPARRNYDYVPRVAPRPERIEVVGGLLGMEVRPAPSLILDANVYDLPLVANSWVEAELHFLVNDRRTTLDHWIQRGAYYREFVTSVFREYGLPTDLYHLAMIESGYLPTARSVAGAVGMWQFMPATSRDVNLRVDNTVDERMDPVRSTRAAALHLRSLYRIHGDWALAAAAYNAGSGRISRGLERYGATNFWDLASRGDLANETQHYVPRLFAMTIVGRDPERFGFPPPQPTETFAFDSIYVDQSLPLPELAEMSRVPVDRLVEMNPHLRRGITPPGGYWVWVPGGMGPLAQQEYLAAASREGTYVVQWGDNLSMLAQRTGVSSARIRDMNPRIDFDRLQTGATLRLPAAAAALLNSRGGDSRTSLATAGGGPSVHRVRAGDTLSQIAARYGVTVRAIQDANSLRGTVIRTGQQLTIPPAVPAASTASRPIEHVVAPGDTLWDIARRYGSSVEAIRSANGLGERQIIPGQRLDVPPTLR